MVVSLLRDTRGGTEGKRKILALLIKAIGEQHVNKRKSD